jgi:hypothetical protein
VQYLLDNLEETGDYYTLPSDVFEIVAMSASRVNLPTLQLLLLDSCSTLCLISNPDLLDNIHEVPVGVRVRCNAGTTHTNLQGYLGDFPEPVWYNPGGIVNILSLKVVAKYYNVEYISRTEDAFIVTGPNGVRVKFELTAKGLYACSVRPGGSASDAWAFINLVHDIKGEYMILEYRDVALARKVQNIMMFPNAHAYSRIVDSNQLANCPVKHSDIVAAERIFGPNLGGLKGKTVYHARTPVTGRIDGIPPNIRDRYQHVVLGVDIMFVNKIPFLITVARGLRIGTVEVLNNWQVPTVAACLGTVFRTYRRRGLQVSTCNVDPEFEPLQNMFDGTSFNLCAQDEHVP